MKEEIFIEELYNGINMGILSIEHLIDKIEDKGLKRLIEDQKDGYEKLKKKVVQDFPYHENKIKNKFMIESMIEMKTLMSDDAKIAKMLIEGSNQAIMTMTHLLNEEENVNKMMQDFAKQFEELSKKYIEQLKPYI